MASGAVDVAALVRLLRSRKLTVATAESLTGGLVAAALTSVSGASSVYRGGVIAYATDLKAVFAGVPLDVLADAGAVAAVTAAAMAAGVRGRAGADLGLATTGVAGPDLQEGQPPGTVHIGIADGTGTRVRSPLLSGSRWAIREATVAAALALLADTVAEHSSATAPRGPVTPE